MMLLALLAALQFHVPSSAFLVRVHGSVQNAEPRTSNLEPRTEQRTRTRNLEQGTRNQPRRLPPPPPPPPPRFGIRGYVLAGSATLTAKRTFDAVADTHRRSLVGGGAQVTRIWKDVFADVGVSQLSIDGERVFVDNLRVFKLGIPLEVTMRSVDVAGGWRFRLARGRVLPYAGAGMTYLQYEETSDFAAPREDVREGRTGPLLLGGVDVRVWRWVSAGSEVRWRRVRGILGEGGVSSDFGEDDAGGLNVGVRVSVAIRE